MSLSLVNHTHYQGKIISRHKKTTTNDQFQSKSCDKFIVCANNDK